MRGEAFCGLSLVCYSEKKVTDLSVAEASWWGGAIKRSSQSRPAIVEKEPEKGEDS